MCGYGIREWSLGSDGTKHQGARKCGNEAKNKTELRQDRHRPNYVLLFHSVRVAVASGPHYCLSAFSGMECYDTAPMSARGSVYR